MLADHDAPALVGRVAGGPIFCVMLIVTLMATSRIDLLQRLLTQDPDSTFTRYGLAMECVKAGEFARAMAEFEAVIAVDPKYSAAYYHGGQTLEKMGERDRAREVYRRGLAASADAHARAEMQAALDILGD